MDIPELFRQALLSAQDELKSAAVGYASAPADHSDRETEEALDELLIAAVQYTAVAQLVRGINH